MHDTIDQQCTRFMAVAEALRQSTKAMEDMARYAPSRIACAAAVQIAANRALLSAPPPDAILDPIDTAPPHDADCPANDGFGCRCGN